MERNTSTEIEFNITKALIIENCKISKSAKEKIEKAGGSIKTSK